MSDTLTTFKSLKDIEHSCDRLYCSSQLESVIDQMAQQINEDFVGKELLAVTVLNGGLIFAGQLLPKLAMPVATDYCHATRYLGEIRGGELHWKAHPKSDVSGKHVLVIDDIYDEGNTLLAIIEYFRQQKAASVFSAVLVDKQHDRKADSKFTPNYVGLTVPDRYIFGYGMDLDHQWRNAPGIYALKN